MKSQNIVVCGSRSMEMKSQMIEPLGEHQLLCKSVTSLISMGSEVYHYLGNVDPDQHWSELLSHEFVAGYCTAGIVEKVGTAVTGFQKGDLVYGGIGHREYFTVNDTLAQKVPEGITQDQAAFTTLLRTGMYTAYKGNVRCGSTVIIIGCGLLGLCSLQFCRVSGATRIIAIDPVEKRASLAKKLGATHVFHKRVQDIPVEEIQTLLGGKLADTVVDAAGQPDTFAAACELTRNDGHLCLISDPPDVKKQSVGTNMLIGYLNVHGIFINMMIEDPNAFYPMTLQESHEAVYDCILNGGIDVDAMITDRIAPQEVIPLMPKLAESVGDHVGIIIDWAQL